MLLNHGRLNKSWKKDIQLIRMVDFEEKSVIIRVLDRQNCVTLL